MARLGTVNGFLSSNTVPGLLDFPYTVSFWFKPNGTLNNYSPWGMGGAIGGYYVHAFCRSAGPAVRIRFGDGTGTSTLTSSGNYLTDAWNHLTIIGVSSTERYISLNGEARGGGSGLVDRAMTGGTSQQYICARTVGTTTSQFFDGGEVAEVAVWTEALTEEQCLQLYMGVEPPLIGRDIAFYVRMLHDAANGNDHDLVGGLVLTETNTLEYSDHPPMFYDVPSYGFGVAPIVAMLPPSRRRRIMVT